MHVLLTGGGGMLASAIAQAWSQSRPDDRLTALTRRDADLTDAAATRDVIDRHRPDAVIHTAAFVGGIGDKTARPLPYLIDNLRIDASVLEAVVSAGVETYVYVASAAAYPADAPNPIVEESLFGGPLEPANEPYGLAKLTGLTAVGYAARQTGRTYRTILPSNLYGPQDTFELGRAHLIASTLAKTALAHRRGAETVEVWGDGTARREFTYAPDLASWLAESIQEVSSWPAAMNVGAGIDYSIREFYELAARIVGFEGRLEFDTTKPSGVPQRLIDSSRARAHGWSPRTPIADGMAACYESFLARTANGDLS